MLNTLLSLITSVVVCSTGTLSQYAERPTLEVLRNRSVQGRTAYTLPTNLKSFDGFLAVRDCNRLGEVVTVKWQDHTSRMLVFDCSGDVPTTNWMTRNNILGEVDYWTARDWKMIGRGIPQAQVCRTLTNKR